MKKGKGSLSLMKTVLAMCMSFLLVFTPVIGAAAPLVAEASGPPSGAAGLAGKTSSYFSSLFEGSKKGERDFEKEFEQMVEDGKFDSVTESFNTFAAGVMEDETIAGSLRQTVYRIASEDDLYFVDDPINALLYKILTDDELKYTISELIGGVLLDEDLMGFLEQTVEDVLDLLTDGDFEDFLTDFLLHLLVEEDGLRDDLDEIIFSVVDIFEEYADELMDAIDMDIFEDFIDDLMDIVTGPFEDYIESLLDEDHPDYNEDLGSAVERLLNNVTGLAEDFIEELMNKKAFEDALDELLAAFMEPANEHVIDVLLGAFKGPCGECGDLFSGCLGAKEEDRDPTVDDCLEHDGNPLLATLLPRVMNLVGTFTYCGECTWCDLGECQNTVEDGEDTLTCQDDGHPDFESYGDYCAWCVHDCEDASADQGVEYKCEEADESFKALMDVIDGLLEYLNENTLGDIGEQFDDLMNAFLDTALDIGGDDEGPGHVCEHPDSHSQGGPWAEGESCISHNLDDEDWCDACVAELEEDFLMALLDIDDLADAILGFLLGDPDVEEDGSFVYHLMEILDDDDTMDGLNDALEVYLDDDVGEEYIGNIITVATSAVNHALEDVLDPDDPTSYLRTVLVPHDFAELEPCEECAGCIAVSPNYEIAECDELVVKYGHPALDLILGDPDDDDHDGILMDIITRYTKSGYTCRDAEHSEHGNEANWCDGCARDCVHDDLHPAVWPEGDTCSDQLDDKDDWCQGCLRECDAVEEQGDLHIAMFGDRSVNWADQDGGAFEEASMEELLDLVGEHTDVFVAVLMDYVGGECEMLEVYGHDCKTEHPDDPDEWCSFCDDSLIPFRGLAEHIKASDVEDIVESLFDTLKELDVEEIFSDLDDSMNRTISTDEEPEDPDENIYYCGCGGDADICDYDLACIYYRDHADPDKQKYAYLMSYGLISGVLDGIAEGLLAPDEFCIDPDCAEDPQCDPAAEWGDLCNDCKAYNMLPATHCEEDPTCISQVDTIEWDDVCSDCQSYCGDDKLWCLGPDVPVVDGGCEGDMCLSCQVDDRMETVLMSEANMLALYGLLGGRFDTDAGWRVDDDCDEAGCAWNNPCVDCQVAGDRYYLFEQKKYRDNETNNPDEPDTWDNDPDNWPSIIEVITAVVMEIVEDPHHPDAINYPKEGNWGVDADGDPFSRLGAFLADVTGDPADRDDGGMLGDIMEDDTVLEYGQIIGGAALGLMDRVGAPAMQLLRPRFYVREFLDTELLRLHSFVDEDYISGSLWRIGDAIGGDTAAGSLIRSTDVGTLPDTLMEMFIGAQGDYDAIGSILGAGVDGSFLNTLGVFVGDEIISDEDMIALKASLFAEDLPKTVTDAGQGIQDDFADRTASQLAVGFNDFLAGIIPADDIEIRLYGVPCFECDGCEDYLDLGNSKEDLIANPDECELFDNCIVQGLDPDDYCDGCVGDCLITDKSCIGFDLPESDWCAQCEADNPDGCTNIDPGDECADVFGVTVYDEYQYCAGCLGECENKTPEMAADGMVRMAMGLVDGIGDMIEGFLDYDDLVHYTGAISHLLDYEGECLVCDVCEQDLCGGDPGDPAEGSECFDDPEVSCLDCGTCEYIAEEGQDYSVREGIKEIMDDVPAKVLDFGSIILQSEYPAAHEHEDERIIDVMVEEIITDIFAAELPCGDCAQCEAGDPCPTPIDGPLVQILDGVNAVLAEPATEVLLKEVIEDVVWFDVAVDAGGECGVCDNCVCEYEDEDGDPCGVCPACLADCLFEDSTLLGEVDTLIVDLIDDDNLMTKVMDLLFDTLDASLLEEGHYQFEPTGIVVLGVTGLVTLDPELLKFPIYEGFFAIFEMMEEWLVDEFTFYKILDEDKGPWEEGGRDYLKHGVDFSSDDGNEKDWLPCGSCDECDPDDPEDANPDGCTEQVDYYPLNDLFGADFIKNFLEHEVDCGVCADCLAEDPCGEQVPRLNKYVIDPIVDTLIPILDSLTDTAGDITEAIGERIIKSLYYDDGGDDMSPFGAIGEYLEEQVTFYPDPACVVPCDPTKDWDELCADCREFNLDLPCGEGCDGTTDWEDLCDDCREYASSDLVNLIRKAIDLIVYEDGDGKGGLLEKIGVKIDGNENLVNIGHCGDGGCAECNAGEYTDCDDAELGGLIVELIMIVEDIVPESSEIYDLFDDSGDPDSNFDALQTIIEAVEVIIDTDRIRDLLELEEYCGDCPWCDLEPHYCTNVLFNPDPDCVEPCDPDKDWDELCNACKIYNLDPECTEGCAGGGLGWGDLCDECKEYATENGTPCSSVHHPDHDDEGLWCDYCTLECTGEFGPTQVILDLVSGDYPGGGDGIMAIFNHLSDFLEADSEGRMQEEAGYEIDDTRAFQLGDAVENIPAVIISGLLGEEDMATLVERVIDEQFILDDGEYDIGNRILNVIGDVASNENTISLVGELVVDGVTNLYGFFTTRFMTLRNFGEGDQSHFSGGAELAADSPYDPYMLQAVPSLGMNTLASATGLGNRTAGTAGVSIAEEEEGFITDDDVDLIISELLKWVRDMSIDILEDERVISVVDSVIADLLGCDEGLRFKDNVNNVKDIIADVLRDEDLSDALIKVTADFLTGDDFKRHVEEIAHILFDLLADEELLEMVIDKLAHLMEDDGTAKFLHDLLTEGIVFGHEILVEVLDDLFLQPGHIREEVKTLLGNVLADIVPGIPAEIGAFIQDHSEDISNLGESLTSTLIELVPDLAVALLGFDGLNNIVADIADIPLRFVPGAVTGAVGDEAIAEHIGDALGAGVNFVTIGNALTGVIEGALMHEKVQNTMINSFDYISSEASKRADDRVEEDELDVIVATVELNLGKLIAGIIAGLPGDVVGTIVFNWLIYSSGEPCGDACDFCNDVACDESFSCKCPECVNECQNPQGAHPDVDLDKPISVGTIGDWIPGIMGDLQDYQDAEDFLEDVTDKGFDFLGVVVNEFFDSYWDDEAAQFDCLKCAVCTQDRCGGEPGDPAEGSDCEDPGTDCLDCADCDDPLTGGVVQMIDDLLRNQLDFTAFANELDGHHWRNNCGTCDTCLQDSCGGSEGEPAPGSACEDPGTNCLDCAECETPLVERDFVWDALAEAIFGDEFDDLIDELAKILQDHPDVLDCPSCDGTGLEDGVGPADCDDCYPVPGTGVAKPLADIIEDIIREVIDDVVPLVDIMEHIVNESGDLANNLANNMPEFNDLLGGLADILRDEDEFDDHILAKIFSEVFGFLKDGEWGAGEEGFPVDKISDFLKEDIVDAAHPGDGQKRGEYIAGELIGTVLENAADLTEDPAITDIIYEAIFGEDGVLMEEGSYGKTIMKMLANWADDNLYETLDGLLWSCNHDDEECSHADPCALCLGDGLGYGSSEIQSAPAAGNKSSGFFSSAIAGAVNWVVGLAGGVERVVTDAEEGTVELQFTTQEEDLIPDAELRKAIKGALVIYDLDEELTDGPGGTLENIRFLTAVNRGIEDLEGLQHLTNLVTLDLAGNDIEDLTAGGSIDWAADLGNLESLNLSGNPLHEAEAANMGQLAGLTELMSLDLSGTGITGIGDLNGLTNMKRLNLSGNAIEDIGAVGNMPELQRLYLDGNITMDTNIDALEGLVNLDTLSLMATGFTNARMAHIGNLQTAKNAVPEEDRVSLRNLYLAFNGISDLTNLAGVRVVNLDISDNLALSGGLNHLEDTLVRLDVSFTDIDSAALAGLNGKTSLRELYLADTDVDLLDTVDWEDLKKLEKLDLSGNGVLNNIAGMVHLESLKELWLSGITIDPAAVPNLFDLFDTVEDTLRLLDLSDNGLDNATVAMANLDELTALEELNLSGNNITDLDAAGIGDIDLNATMQGIKLVLQILPSEQFKGVQYHPKAGNGGALYLADNPLAVPGGHDSRIEALEGKTFHTLDLFNTGIDCDDIASFVGNPGDRITMKSYEGGGILNLSGNAIETLEEWKAYDIVQHPNQRRPRPETAAVYDELKDLTGLFLQDNLLGEIYYLTDHTDRERLNWSIIDDLERGGVFVRKCDQGNHGVEHEGLGGGEIQGSVTDIERNPLAGAEVTAGTVAEDQDGITIHSSVGYAVTLEDGTFTLNLEPGKYELKIELDGYLPLLITDPDQIELVSGQTYELKEGIMELFGDVGNTGSVDVADAIMVLRALVELDELDEDELARAMVSGGEGLVVADAILILRKVVGLVDILPAS